MKDFQILVPFEKSVSEGGELKFFGGIASSGALDRDGDRMTKGALKKMSSQLDGATVFFNHETKKLAVGKVVNTDFDGGQVRINAIPTKAAGMQDVVTQIGEGLLKSFSIGGKIMKHSRVHDDKLGKDVREIEDVDIYEVSVVGVPANPEATITSYLVKSFEGEKLADDNSTKGAADPAVGCNHPMMKMEKCATCNKDYQYKLEPQGGPGEIKSVKASDILESPDFKKVMDDVKLELGAIRKEAADEKVRLEKQLAASGEELKAAQARIELLHKSLNEKAKEKGLVSSSEEFGKSDENAQKGKEEVKEFRALPSMAKN
jgi:HK97 family phage prohead protease